jgi:RNA polymerase sigma-70 factor (ECF subfamily)
MAEPESPKELQDHLRAAWHRYVDMLVPLRPTLHGYCRRLAGNLWDAEDLVQDTLVRAFGHLGLSNHEIRNPRAYLLRTATNVWIDELRRRETEARSAADRGAAPSPGESPETSSHVRDAGARLLQRLAPQERAAVVLKELFDMTLEEIAELLATTTGAVKAALHRGRGRLREPEGAAASRRARPSPELLDRFIERYEARDLKGLAQLMLDGAAVENVGEALQVGRDTFERTERNILWHLVHGHEEWPPALRWDSARIERADLDGEPLLLYLVAQGDRESLISILRVEERDGRIARLRSYGFCPETMRDAGEALGRRVATGLYRAPTPAPGEYWPKRT